MTIQNKPMQRRGFLRGALATAVLLPLGGALASCAGGSGSSETSAAPGGEVDPTTNPFGVASTGKVDAVIFKGGYGIDYVEFAGKIFAKYQPLH